MIKAAFFDLDGTLFSHSQKKVPDSTILAFKELKEKGIKRVLCTGRHIVELRQLGILDLGLEFDGYVLLNGQIILDENQKYLDGTPIRDSETKKIVKLFNEKDFSLILENIDELYANIMDDFYLEGLKSVNTKPFPIKEYDERPIFQVSTYVKKERQEFLREYLNDCYITSWNEYGLCIVDKDGGKSKGMEKYLKKMGLNKDETIAFGDGDNDVDMLQYAKIGVAMGNGVKAAKEASDYVTNHIDENGLYNALKHFSII